MQIFIVFSLCISQICCTFAVGMYGRFHILLLMLLCSLSACTPHAVREAKQTVQQSDSLWRAGQPYADSAQLAQAYETLGQWALFCPDDYAHACYHYGKLLRARENPVEAMQCFINATHSHTRDYHNLGRVYSNMGSICHLASEYPLSYDMYAKSANMFLRNGDSINYYYALNDMAFEKALLADKTTALSLVTKIEKSHIDEKVLKKTLETKAELYLKCRHYDSAVYYASTLYDTNKSISFLIRAQAYSREGRKDSATYYAEQLLELSHDLSDVNNALYILTNDDVQKDIDAIREIAANRADIQKILKFKQGKLSKAVQLIEQDTQRKFNFSWMYYIIVTLFVVGIVIWICIRYKRKHHQLLSQQISDLESRKKQNLSQMRAQIEEKCLLFTNSTSLKTELNWNEYDTMCRCVDKHFYLTAKKLQIKNVLNEQEIRLCILTLLNFNRNQIADVLHYAPNGVGKLKYRVAQKLGIEGKNLRKYLICLAIDEPYK